ncbi:molybdopterin-dependent oxidoreductase [Variovorax sp. Sphag1AA]|uniref:molybdopterin-dependent oxidoreductase n=1 Tax=Variovorax sp. Sphag1AA TaxID=2587027 RepID=UPI00160E3477|nr:molybdopterin-dependent oxidoreductase [Variovorax sp. Sphag1AA]MBB3177812.1 DMSO/TMAO reductase YedYZ molybdopterin-dependent catalytic subunit [Variovorax sp. Sphag1AA]
MKAATVLAEPTLSLSGHVPHPRQIDMAEIFQLKRRELGPTQVNCFTGRPVFSAQSYVGVRLIDLLDRSGFSSQPRSELKRCVVIAQGADDYQAIFSWNELYNADAGDGVLVVYERDGELLREPVGPLSLLATADRQLGPRHLRGLREIRVRLL